MIFKLSRLFGSNTKWLESKQNSILSAAFIITIANVISSISGLIRERFLISSFFHTESSQLSYEAFQVAFQIPDMLFQLIVLGALSAAFIPIFTVMKKKNSQEALTMSAVVMNLLLLVFFVVGLVVFIYAEPITSWRTGSQFTAEQVLIAVNLTRLMLFAQLFFAISNFLTGILQSYQRFIIPAIAPIFYNLGILLGVYLFSDRFGIYSAGIGVIIGAFSHMILQLPLAFKLGFRFKFLFSINYPGVKKLFKLMPPRLLTIGVTELQNLSLGFFATSLGNLSFVIVRLALRLMTIPIRLFGVPISQASLPFLSKESGDHDHRRFSQLVLQSLHQIAFFAMPASILLLILRVPIVRLIFGAQNFPWKTTVITGKVVAIIAVSIAAQAMVQLLIRAFHALKDTKTPLLITIATVVVYLVISASLVFATNFGIYGLAIATSVSAFVELLLFIFFLHKKIGHFTTKYFWLPQVKMIVSSFLMAVFLYLPFRILDELVFDTSRTLELLLLTTVTGTIGMLVYVYFSALFEVRELKYFTGIFEKFGKWRQPLRDTGEVFMETSVEGDEV